MITPSLPPLYSDVYAQGSDGAQDTCARSSSYAAFDQILIKSAKDSLG